MSVGLLLLGVMLGGAAATVALISGQSPLFALALYAGFGALSVAGLALVHMCIEALRERKTLRAAGFRNF